MGIVDPKQHVDELDQELESIQKPNDDNPKYKGKSLEDVIKMHEEAERKASRLGNEIGQLRQELQPRKVEEPKKIEVKVDDLLENPAETVTTVVEQSPSVRKLNKTVEQLEMDLHKRDFETKNPNYHEDLNSEDFHEWIGQSRVRKALAQAADKYDYVAAGELWDLWTERNELVKGVQEQKAKDKETKRKEQLKAATLESGTGVSTEGKKVFRRSEIIDLKHRAALGDRKAQATVEDPAWQREIRQAYMDKRVK
jgi:hypothetical protein